jgi:hypothetical protein
MNYPARIESFEVRDERDVTLWRIQTSRPTELKDIRYPQVPLGFVQVIPEGGIKARKFVNGEILSTFTVAEDHTLLHHGQAVGETGFCGGVYEAAPRSPKTSSPFSITICSVADEGPPEAQQNQTYPERPHTPTTSWEI